MGGTLIDFQDGNFEAMMNAANWQTAFYNNTEFNTPNRVQWERRTPPGKSALVLSLCEFVFVWGGILSLLHRALCPNISYLSFFHHHNVNLPDHFVMLNADIALVRDLSGFIGNEDGQVSQCNFRAAPRCPHAVETFDIAAEYKHDNVKFLEDFQSVFTKMIEAGSDTSQGCSLPPCPLPGTFTESPSSSPTLPRPTSAPSLPQPSSSPTPKPTRTPAIAIVTEQEYDAIDADIAALSAAFGNDDLSRGHFLGGIVRLVAHGKSIIECSHINSNILELTNLSLLFRLYGF